MQLQDQNIDANKLAVVGHDNSNHMVHFSLNGD